MQIKPIFRDRFDAGTRLAEFLTGFIQDPESLVLALPRGGVPVGFEVARALHVGLDIFLVRKLGLPGHEELAIGAIASRGVRVLNEDLVKELQLSRNLIDQITAREERELKRTIILVDDGLATGASMKAASRALRSQGPRRIIVAVPVAAKQTCDEFRTDVDQVVCAYTPAPFIAVGIWYEDFSQTTDEEVQRLLELAEQQATVPRD